VDLVARRAVEPVFLGPAEVELREQPAVEIRQLPRGARGRVEGKQLVGPGGGVVEEDHRAAFDAEVAG
jgi:hypothetical protein